jgi:hypothetical protein
VRVSVSVYRWKQDRGGHTEMVNTGITRWSDKGAIGEMTIPDCAALASDTADTSHTKSSLTLNLDIARLLDGISSHVRVH